MDVCTHVRMYRRRPHARIYLNFYGCDWIPLIGVFEKSDTTLILSRESGRVFLIKVIHAGRHGRTMQFQVVLLAMFNPVWIGAGVLLTVLVGLLLLAGVWTKGRSGEFRVNAGLRLLLGRKSYYLMKNVTLPIGDGTTQIDQLIVSQFGVFVVETKNMTGWIFGQADQPQWTQVIYHHRQKFQNPLRQNYKHVKSVQQILGLGRDQIFNCVVFVGDSTFRTPMPDGVVQGVFALARFVKAQRNRVLQPEELPILIDTLSRYRLKPGLRTKFAHVRHVKRRVSNMDDTAGGCPNCGSAMVERTNKRSGERFLGCERFPRCMGTRSLQPTR